MTSEMYMPSSNMDKLLSSIHETQDLMNSLATEAISLSAEEYKEKLNEITANLSHVMEITCQVKEEISQKAESL